MTIKVCFKSGEVIGKLNLNYDNNNYSYDLIVREDIKKASLFRIIGLMFKDIISGVKMK